MSQLDLSETLVAVVSALQAPADTGIVITGAEVDLPLELRLVRRGSQPAVVGGPPHTRWISGVLPPVHLSHLVVELIPASVAPAESDTGGP